VLAFALAAAVAVVATLAMLATPARAQIPVGAPPVTIDGPSPDIVGLSGFSVARDGSGGIAYLKNVAGVPRVFVSRLVGGSFQTPEEVDASLPGSSSTPVIAAGNGGLLLIAFINNGSLYVVDRPSTTGPYVPPRDLFDGASNPQIQISTFGKAYLAFTAVGAGGHDVRAAYYYNGQWGLESTPLDVLAGDDTGTGQGRPAVAAGGDGVGIVGWGEGGHVYARRVWGTTPSLAFEQADVPALGGSTEVVADQPSVGVGGDSTYVNVVFHEVLTSGGVQQSRVLMNRLHAAVFDGVTQPDGISGPGSAGADQPAIADSEYGRGIVTSEHDDSHQLWAALLGNSGVTKGITRVDSLQNASSPFAVAGMDGLTSGFIAWQQSPGSAGSAEIRARFYTGSALGPEQVLSSPSWGPTDAASGLATAGDVAGDGAMAFVQGTGNGRRIVVTQLYQPPGRLGAVSAFRYVRTVIPRLSWSAPRSAWGPIRYLVSMNGVPVAQTTATALTVPAALSQGAHTWSVTAVNPAGLTSNSRAGTVWVDTVPPAVRFKLTGRQRVGSELHINVSYSDSPPPVPRAAASGISSGVVEWGDGKSYRITHSKFHAYSRRGRYKLSVVVKDKAGNTTTLVRQLKIVPMLKPKKTKHKKSTAPPQRRSGGAHA
jgi:hypothetical protein